MHQNVFVSYSRRDEVLADALVAHARTRNLAFWYDKMIPAGGDWRDSIVDAITRSDVLLILFSEESNQSRQVIKELAVADRLGKLVIPVLVEDAEPRGAYLYEMASRNWINLHPDPMARLDALLDKLTLQLAPRSTTAGGELPATAAPQTLPRSGPAPATASPPASATAPQPAGAVPQSPARAPVEAVPPGPVRPLDVIVLGGLLVLNFVLGVWTIGKTYPAPGLNMFLLLAYMFVVAIRNARLNIGIGSWRSFSIYLAIGLLLIPFGLMMDWINGVEEFGNYGLTFGIVILAVIAAGIANVMQFVLRKIFQRNIFRSRLGSALPA